MKNKVIQIRLSEEELNIIKAKAKELDLSVSNFMRKVALKANYSYIYIEKD